MQTQDKIEREIFIPVPQQRVWDAITQAEQIGKWFAKRVEVDFRVGGDVTLYWQSGEKAWGKIEAIDPPKHFAFRWDAKHTPEETPLIEGNSTLVTFHLSSTNDGTTLKVVETGFAALPAHIREAAWQENDHGWLVELGELKDYLLA